MAADELDAIIFGMAVESVRALPLGFAEKVAEIANRSHGVLLFDLRIDGDLEMQRIAAVRYPSNQTGILALDKQGSAISHCMVNGNFSSSIAPLEDWNTLPLPNAGQDEYRRPGQPLHRRLTQCRIHPARQVLIRSFVRRLIDHIVEPVGHTASLWAITTVSS
ncbi:hypothetical protein [Mesorhizobium sp. M0643]|uniref:hypothetical protein n=1 Tax=Mesorhizobium sp. M0643 TaxID=2956978 RepID=UPI003334BF71